MTCSCFCHEPGAAKPFPGHPDGCPCEVAGRTPSRRWEGIVEVCKTCDRKAQWPFCEHKTDDGSWYRLVVVREVGR